MKTTHNSSEMIGSSHASICAKDQNSLTEFYSNILGAHQDFELSQAEDELLNELEVLSARRDFSSLWWNKVHRRQITPAAP